MAKRYERDRLDPLLQYKGLQKAKGREQAMRAEMNRIRSDPMLSPGEKRQRLDALTQERNALLKGAVEARESR